MVYGWERSTWNYVQPKQSLGKCKVKPQCATTAYLLEWLEVKRPTLPNVGKDVDQTVDGNLR